MKTISALLLSAAALSPLAAHAEGGTWYAAIAIGQSTYDADKGDADRSLNSAGFAITDSSLDDSDTGYKIMGGYKFNDNLAVEAGYVDLGHATYKVSVTGANAKLDLHAYGLSVDAVGTLPFGAGFSGYLRAGLIAAWVESDVSATGSGGSASDDSTDSSVKPAAGVGLAYDLNETLTVRIEYERYFDLKSDAGNGDIDLASVGLVARF